MQSSGQSTGPGGLTGFLFGDTPPEFLIEVVVRTAITYILLLAVLRLMGKRMGGQLTISELAVMLTLGAIVSLPMQVPDKGILQGLLVLLCMLALQRWFTLAGIRSPKIEEITQGTEKVLIKNGIIDVSTMQSEYITQQQVFAVLRQKNIKQLGEVSRLYIEACGLFSVYHAVEPSPGLSVFPDREKPDGQLHVDKNLMVCKACGAPSGEPHTYTQTCRNCNNSTFEPAVKP
ncbi:DUF421 domain-containing protein [Pedobacter sp. SYP-B3415]|uniref:DUF421 domain-containing protein n=1 Tax=Pedobacter sp. SYP-B3415 TaxID=2496641 RepID=UPI00101C7DE5|nr:YetF domain-containing protein [Pedobacter sp. SYP-B3415]